MFFQSIYQMLAAGTDLSINIRRMDGNLSVVVMPRRTNLKDEAGQLIVPLVLNGTPVELDEQFLPSVTTPLQKAQGILVNLETFEKQAEQATAQSKATKSANDKESKEAREKREKREKLFKRAEEAFAAGRHSEAITCFKQAKILADADKQKEIEERIQEVQKKSSEGSLFAEAISQTQPIPQQPVIPLQPTISQQLSVNGATNGQQANGQMQMFAPQPMPQPQMAQFQPAPQTYQPEVSQPVYGQYYQQPVNGMPGQQRVELYPMGQPQMYIGQPGGQPQQWQQPQPIPQQPQTIAMQVAPGSTGREYHSQPQPTDTLCFDKDDESDRALLREDPYAEYLDFPEEYRMKDQAQMELVCC